MNVREKLQSQMLMERAKTQDKNNASKQVKPGKQITVQNNIATPAKSRQTMIARNARTKPNNQDWYNASNISWTIHD